MAWKVRLADGTLSDPIATFEEAEELRRSIEETDTRTPDEIWAAARKPLVDRATFMRRMAMGWKPDRALYTTITGRWHPDIMRQAYPRVTERLGGRDAEQHEVLGRSRTLRQWSESCGRSVSQLHHGIERHGSLQAYFLNTGWYPSKPAVAGDPEISDDRFT